LQNSDVSKGERKRERLGSIAAVVCFSTESKGSFYRRGRGRELGFLKGGLAGKIPSAAALAMTLGHGDGSWVTRLLRWRAGVTRWPRQRLLACSPVGWQWGRERHLFHRPPAGVRLAPVRVRQRRGLGCRRVLLRVRGRTVASSTVGLTFLKTCSQVFDEMSERNSNSNFWKLPPWVVKIFSKVSKYIFVKWKGDVLQKNYFKNWVWSLFQIQTLADVWVGFWFEFLFETSWSSEYVVWSSSTNWPHTQLIYRFLNLSVQSRVMVNFF
jgi:hypothetical protein